MKKIIVFLLLLNFTATIAVGYTIYKNNSKKPYEINIESPSKIEDEQFKANVYEGMNRLMMGQNMINLRMLSLHHFVKPHGDDIYEHCPECQLEHPEITEDQKNNITSNKEAKEWNL